MKHKYLASLAIIMIALFLISCTPGEKQVKEPAKPVIEADKPVTKEQEKTNQKEKTTQEKTEVKKIEMIAKQFSFNPSTVTVKKGDTVQLVVSSIDVDHGIAIPAYNINTRLKPGTKETIEFTATKSGTFEFFCSVSCGSGHRGMRGTLIVEE